MLAIRAQMAAVCTARAADVARKRNPKDSDGDDSMGAQLKAPGAGTADATGGASASTVADAATQQAAATTPVEPTEPKAATPTAPAPQSTPAISADELQRQAAILERAKSAATTQQGDSQEVAHLRSALRGRMVGDPIDYNFLEQGIQCVMAATNSQLPDADEVDDDVEEDGPNAPSAKNQRTDDPTPLGTEPEDEL